MTESPTPPTVGGLDALDDAFPLAYEELRRIARRQLGRLPNETLRPTALVHEAYLKLAGGARVPWRDRAHFLAIASTAMRQVLIDHARGRCAVKRGGARCAVTLDDATLAVEEQAVALVELDEALTRLAAVDPRLARVVELRFFGGLSEEEAAQVLGLTTRTVRRDWVKARGLLHQALHG
jgi:RNA polymerase sigma factor (TIGR02999 family)